MTSDPRAVSEYRVPAVSLKPGDLVNTSPGEDDWQEVVAVHTSSLGVDEPALRSLMDAVAGRYVVVQLTDLAPLDSDVYFSGGTAMTNSPDDGGDHAVLDVVSTEDGRRTYLYTKYELVTIRSVG